MAAPDQPTQNAPKGQAVQVPPNCDLTLGLVCIDKTVPGRTVWQMQADERFANPVGIIQGGFLAAMADGAMGAASVTFARERKVYSFNAEMKISFLRQAKVGTTLTCTAEVISGGSTTAFAEASIVDSEDRLVARASSTFMLRAR